MTLAAFGDDPGTLYPIRSTSESIKLADLKQRRLRRRINKLLNRQPLIWFVDDEAANRLWFAQHHQRNYNVLTFSSRDYCAAALHKRIPCDAVVTDIFFPACIPRTDEEAQRLLSIYQMIDDCTVKHLPKLWDEVCNQWHLDGFDVAKDVTAYGKRRHERIPVLLFSRKATLLLNRRDWLDEAASVENTFWLFEKVQPTVKGDDARRAASIQRERIAAVLRFRKLDAPLWLRLLRLFSFTWLGFSFKVSGDAEGK